MSTAPSENVVNGFDSELLDTVEPFFAQLSDHSVVEKAEADGGLPTALWTKTAELGLTLLAVPEESGGSGGTLLDAAATALAAGRQAVPLPLVETLVGAWLAAAAGLDAPEGPVTFALDPRDELTLDGTSLSGTVHQVPWLSVVDQLVVAVPGADGQAQVAVVAVADLDVKASVDLAGQPNGSATLSGVTVTVGSAPVALEDLVVRAALLRAAQIAGALAGASDLTAQYVQERVQFGKPIGSFQAVQQHVVTLAQSAIMSRSAVERAAAAIERGAGAFEARAAKYVAGHSAVLAARAAHQAHGAIGMTQEYRLHQLTRRLHLWRNQAGSELELAGVLGRTAAAAPSLAHLVTAPPTEVAV